MADKYVQMHPLNETKTALDESVNVFPLIGPDSFKNFDPNAASSGVFKVQGELVAGDNIKNISFSSKRAAESVLGKGVVNIPLLDLIYPVGSVYTCTEDKFDGKCPIEELLGGTWVRIKDRFVYAAGDEDTLGSTGGSKDAVVVTHTHTTEQAGEHTHTRGTMEITGDFPGVGETEEARSMYTGAFKMTQANGGMPVANSNASRDCLVEFKASNTWSGETSSKGSHSHIVAAPAGASDGVGKNMPPYLVVYMWKRVEDVEESE